MLSTDAAVNNTSSTTTSRQLSRNTVNHLPVLALDTTTKRLPFTNSLIEELIKVKTPKLSIAVDTQVHVRNVLQREKQDTADDKRVRRNSADLSKLLGDLDTIAVDATRVQTHAVESRNRLVSKDTSEETADHTTDTVKLEDLQTVVDAKPFVDVLAQSADDGRHEADDGCFPETDVAGGGRDADQSGDGALAGADDGEAAFMLDEVDEDPAEDTGRGGGVGVEGGEHGADGGVERGTTVEAEPAESGCVSDTKKRK